MKKILIIALIFTCIDQIIKLFLTSFLSYGQGIVIINNFFSISLLENTGAAFSILRSSTIFLIFISILALILIYLLFIKDKKLTNMDIWLYGTLIGGICGNLCDRIFRGYVVDYLDFNVFNFPVFNLADCLIVVSIIFIIIKIIKGEKNEISS